MLHRITSPCSAPSGPLLRPAWLATLAAAGAMLGPLGLHAAEPATVAAASNRPNILLIVADDLGFSDIGAFGGEIDTPNLNALAKEGLRLTDFHSAATCSPTRSMILSGVDNHVAGLGSMAELLVDEQKGKPGYEGYLNDRVVPFPQLLKQAGYHTYMAGKWHLGLTDERSPTARGFERSFALLRGADDHYVQPWSAQVDPSHPWYREDGQLTSLPTDFYSSNFYADKLVSYLKAGQGDGKPFFAYLTFTAPHWPLQAPADAIAKYAHRYDAGYDAIRAERIARQKALGILPAGFEPAPADPQFPRWQQLTPQQQQQEARRMAIYAAMVDVLDQNVGKVVRQLKASGQYDNTLIIFISDNGAEGANVEGRPGPIPRDNSLANLGKPTSYSGYGPNWAQVSALPFSAFKGYSQEGGITVPTIVRWPGQAQAGSVSPAPGHVTDLAPTFLQLAGVAYPSKVGEQPTVSLQGRSLLPLITGQVPDRGERFDKGWELFGRKAYRQGDWKVVYGVAPFGTGQWQLFNLKTDRAEQHDLATQHPEKLTELRKAYEDYVRANGVQEVPQLAERVARNYNVKGYFDALNKADQR